MSIIHVPPRRALLYTAEVVPDQLFYDSFDDVELTLLANHTPDVNHFGYAWEEIGVSDINTNRLSAKTLPSGYAHAYVQVTRPASLQCIWRNLNDFAYQRPLTFRFVSHSNHWYIDTRPNDNYVAIKKVISGVPTTKDSGTFTHAANNWYGMRVIIDGDNIAVYCGADLDNLGVTAIASCSGDSSLATYTKVGTMFNQQDQRIDDFEANTALVAPT
jgi:hypothetical protein